MYIGVDYYPEHWPQERWETDARLMQEAGFNVVRLAEFAWVNFEPEEGRFDFSWLDQALEILGRHGISAILGTPTAVMPAWVQRKYPETMAMEKNGQRTVWGVRKNNCFTSGAFRLLSERVTRAMAEHFANTPNVIGWQTDNEFGGPVCYCETCRASFQDWLRARYGTLDALNKAWGTHFWGQKYGTWGEIQIPTDDNTYNPSLILDHKRFNSWLNVRFQADQVRILRSVCPQHFITHNFMGLHRELDLYDLAKDLDFVSWDNYPVGLDSSVIPVSSSAAADVMRGLKQKNFWIMETTAGAPGWGAFGRNPRPGEIRKVALQQVAHGCDGLLWFRWRTCTAGREQYWHGLLGHDGKPFRRYREAAQTAADMQRLSAETQGTTVRAEVAMIYDYESNWALDIQPAYDGSKEVKPGWWGQNYTQAIRRWYEGMFRAGVSVDMIPPSANFSSYKAVFAPHLYILPDEVANRLVDYVRQGGVLVTDCRTGVKNETSLCYDRTLPGLLSDPLGITIEEYESIPDGDQYPVQGQDALSGSFTGLRFADWVTPRGADCLAGYQNWHMQPYAAATRNHFQQGWGYYVGTIAQEDSFYDGVIADALAKAGVSPVIRPPKNVEVSVREGEGRKLVFLINHTEEPQTVQVPAGKPELLSGTITGDTLVMERYGVAVIKL